MASDGLAPRSTMTSAASIAVSGSCPINTQRRPWRRSKARAAMCRSSSGVSVQRTARSASSAARANAARSTPTPTNTLAFEASRSASSAPNETRPRRPGSTPAIQRTEALSSETAASGVAGPAAMSRRLSCPSSPIAARSHDPGVASTGWSSSHTHATAARIRRPSSSPKPAGPPSFRDIDGPRPPSPGIRPPISETRPPISETRPPISETRPPISWTRPPIGWTRPPITGDPPPY